MEIKVFVKPKLVVSIFFLLVSGNILQGQTLKRSVFLGAQLMELSAVEQHTGTDSGLYLSQILPNGSFGKMFVPLGTVLQQINGKPVRSMADLSGAMSGIKAGDDLKVIVYENGHSKTYHGLAVGRPLQEHPHARVAYGQINYRDNTLRSLLYLPHGVEKPPVVFFIQGYTCQSIEMRNNNPAKQLIDSWIKDGYAVFLAEKPGMGDSESKTPCMDIDFDQELFAFSKAYEDLRKNTKIDADKIFLFGHSMGGIIAPLLANEQPPAGVMVFGIVGKNWYDYMIDIYTEQPLLFGTSEEEIKEDSKYSLPFIEDMLVHKKTNTELIESPVYGARLKEDGTAAELANGYYIMRHYHYWQTLADVNIPNAWAKVKSPVLVLHGEYDIQAIHPKYGEMIVTNVNNHGGIATFELFPKTEHAFLQFNSREELLQVMNDGSYSETFTTHFNRDIANKSLKWMNQQSK
ncbi:MAG: alpha/beta fold hydrolase [Flavobacteriaceae bacterium]|nr:MAG: alpha/beta fold hydrolase [Flavobacteriaceae bacterium]